MIIYAYMDLDSVAYVGASVAQKAKYQYIHNDGETKSEVFNSARDGKNWLKQGADFEELDPSEWTRKTIVDIQPEKVALKAVDYELESWFRTAKKLTGNDNIIPRGFLTSSGLKDKDIGGLEDRYQFNRYECRKSWTPKEKPVHLKACREYLLTKYDWIKMSPIGVEADAPVLHFAEKRGSSAVCMSKDKDLKQMFKGHFIDMNEEEEYRVLLDCTELGFLDIKENAKGDKTVFGQGFKLLCFQTCVGDVSDGYKGLHRYGQMSGYELLQGLSTVEECCKAMVDLYKTKFPDGKEYKSWDGEKVHRTWEELLIQHCELAYHNRGSKDTTNPMQRYLNNEDPIVRH